MKLLSKYYNSGLSIVIFAILGIFLGFLLGNKVVFLKIIGDVFISLIKMVIIPIIIFAILAATVHLGRGNSAVKMGSLAMSYFFITSFLAAIFGVMLALLLTPGVGLESLPLEMLSLDAKTQAAVDGFKFLTLSDFLFNIIPTNPFFAISQGHLLSILFFSIFMGIAIAYSKNNNKENLINNIEVINDSLMWMVSKIMYLAPIAVFSLMSYLVGTIGIEVVYLVGKLMLTVIVALFVWVYIVLAGCVALFTKHKYFDFIKTTLPLQFMAFSTSSSLVSLAKNIETCDELKVNKNVSRFMLPIGATLNMDGSSIFYSIVAVFFIQFFGLDSSWYLYFAIALTAALGSMATPGVPGLSITIIMVLVVANVPLIGLPLIYAIDRILDMFITTTNVMGDTTGAVLNDRLI